MQLKERNGSRLVIRQPKIQLIFGMRQNLSHLLGPFANSRHSRVALKKYVRANNTINATDAMFDSLFNKALKSGVEKGEFAQPKGMFILYFLIANIGCDQFRHTSARRT
jgi:histone H1/5